MRHADVLSINISYIYIYRLWLHTPPCSWHIYMTHIMPDTKQLGSKSCFCDIQTLILSKFCSEAILMVPSAGYTEVALYLLSNKNKTNNNNKKSLLISEADFKKGTELRTEFLTDTEIHSASCLAQAEKNTSPAKQVISLPSAMTFSLNLSSFLTSCHQTRNYKSRVVCSTMSSPF